MSEQGSYRGNNPASWLAVLREQSWRVEQEEMRSMLTGEETLWGRICDALEAAYNFDARFEERLSVSGRPLNHALAALKAEVEAGV